MLTVNLTQDQLNLLEDLVGEKFNEVAQAWLPAEETKEMNQLCYSTILALRTVRASDLYDREIADPSNPFLISKEDYLKECYYVTDKDLAQQGIAA